MKYHPTALERIDPGTLQIRWNDGAVHRLSVRQLRDQCPCATCREQRTTDQQQPPLLPVLSAEETKPLTLDGMRPVGNYAYCIQFSDGHDTGIFTLEFLRQLGETSN